ncbi:HlyD family secretion protein [Leptolyngbya sp. PCC 6406]|uniref:HlyD family secretion protein n=1 Tax=Leptolyngbya sp. PCC 6406 TaxID=1173264 RepID=UPI0002ACF8C7|nr:efflux RND transporter periplasmic adaptor subunit [Leptolyngbya sp. PCC 6406]
MTTSPNPRQKAPFRVVPPPAAPTPQPTSSPASPPAAPSQPLPTDAPASAASPSATAPETTPFRWPWRGLIVASGLVLAGFIPTPYQVGGEVTLAWPEGDRQQIRAPMRAIVEEFYVAPGDQVTAGQTIVRLSSLDLEREIAQLQRDIDQAQQLLAEVQREQLQAQARVREITAVVVVTEDKTKRAVVRGEQGAQGATLPEIALLEVQRDRLDSQLVTDREEWERYQFLHAQGAIADEEVRRRENNYLNTQKDLQVKAAEIAHTRQRLADTAADEIGNAQVQGASADAAALLAGYRDLITAQEQVIASHRERQLALQAQQQNLVLVSAQTGTVLDDDLDLLVGQEVTPEKNLLRIAQLNQLTANVEVKEEDLNYVQPGAAVTFRPTSSKLTPYDAEVDRVLKDVAPDSTQQRRIATVRVVIDNADQQLRPGSGGYAKIFSEWIPLYQRLGREVIKLVPSRFL